MSVSGAEAAAFPAPWRAGLGSGRAGGRADGPWPLRPESPEPPRPSPALARLRDRLSCVSSGPPAPGPRPRLACPGLPPEQPGLRSPCGCVGRASRVGMCERVGRGFSVGRSGREAVGREEEDALGWGCDGGGSTSASGSGFSSSNKHAARFAFSRLNREGRWMAGESRDRS